MFLRVLGVFVTVIVTLAVISAFLYHHEPWVEIVGKDLLRTNAPSKTIAASRDAVIQKHQNWIVGKDGKRSDPSYQGGGRSWKIGSSPEEIRLKVTRGKTQVMDKNADRISIELISATGTPTLVFIHHDSPGEEENVMNDLVNELTKRGVKVR